MSETDNSRIVLSKNQRITLLVVLVLINFIYFISSAYITCSNDGSHFALVSALAEEGSVKIKSFIQYTRMYDFAYKDGEYYSDRTPGTAFLGVPFYIMGKLVGEAGAGNYLSHHKNIKEVFVIFLPNIAGTLAVFVMFGLSTHFKFNFQTSLVSSIMFAFCTLAWFESTRLFSHAVSMATLLGAVYLLVTLKRFDRFHTGRVLGISCLLALASIIEIQNILVVGVCGFYILISGKISVRKILGGKIPALMITATLVFMVIYSSLLIYNFSAFKELTIKSNKYHALFHYERTFRTAMAGNVFFGLDRLFTNLNNSEVIFNWPRGINNNTPGMFVVSPLLLLSPFGFYYFFRSKRNEAMLFLLIVAAEVVVAALHTGDVSTRYATTVLPYLFFPVVIVVGGSFKLIKGSGADLIKGYFLIAVILILSLVSLARVFYVMNAHWGRSFSSPFMFVAEIPSYIVFYGSLILLFCLARCITRYVRKHSF